MIDSYKVKEVAAKVGADLCGIASVEWFDRWPEGLHPREVYADARAVVVIARRLPASSLVGSTPLSYAFVSTLAPAEMERLTLDLSRQLEELGLYAVPVPCEDLLDQGGEGGQAWKTISLRHAAVLAGLGVIGKNTLLANEIYGNMLQLGAVLVNEELAADGPVTYELCPPVCHRCIEACPQKALSEQGLNWELCRPASLLVSRDGRGVRKCSICQRACPNALGLVRHWITEIKE